VNVHGPEHPDTLIAAYNLGRVYRDVGREIDAIRIFEQVWQSRTRALGIEHNLTLTTSASLAVVYRAIGKLDRALLILRNTMNIIEKNQYKHEYSNQIILELIACLEQLSQYPEAEIWRRKWLAVVKTRAGADTPVYAGELSALALNLLNQQKWVDAEAVLRECLSIRVKTQPELWSTFNTRSSLGGALLGQKKYAEAEPLLLAGLDGMRQREATIPPQGRPRLGEAADRLVELYTATGKPDEAAKWREVRDRYWRIAPLPRPKP